MTTPTVADVVSAAHALWPESLAESWDASGLVLGRAEAPVEQILFAVDPVQAVAQEAVDTGSGLLLTHHPLLLRGAQFLPDTSDKGAVVQKLAENGVALLASHTNADSYASGVSDVLIRACGVEEARPLVGQRDGTGQESGVGLGRVGDLPELVALEELAHRLAGALLPTAAGLRVAGRKDQQVRRVAVCGGAGDSLFDEVRAAGADVYVTADLRHHPASEARERALLNGGRPALIDCSHFASEQLWLAAGAEQLRAELARRGFEVRTRLSAANTDPWDFVVAPGEVPASASTDPAAGYRG